MVNWEDQISKSKDKAKKWGVGPDTHLSLSNHFQVLDILKDELYEVDLSDYFQAVDSILTIAFQIVIHNCWKQSKAGGEDLPASKHCGKAKWSSHHQGDGVQGISAVEILEKK